VGVALLQSDAVQRRQQQGAVGHHGIQSGGLLGSTGLTAGQAYGEMADLLLHGLAARPD
jgi:hypothetical protein